ncbi:uncharacterized protein LOC119995386 [Tripterygium wilfordii]|uniref:uncharacterized protein LOC119995386 n=1 Tax=Tripterygium wilfordii TaxID=458696 RepID=UPI0018F830DE|nr:uncharacterized protein LOC119995386 [Tripterygium wilfordii]
MERKHGRLVPEVHDRLDKEFIKSRSWTAKWIGDNQKAIFQVTKKPHQYVVNVDEASCTCRGWDLSRIPCTHAVAAICWLHRDPAEFVHQAYTKKTYLKVYEHNVQPTNGENLWVAVGGDAIEAPPMKKVVGRPTKKRRREHDEAASRSRLRRRYPKIRCTKCGGEGHNRRGCKNPPMPEQTIDNMRGGRRGGGRRGGTGRGVGGRGIVATIPTNATTKLPVRRSWLTEGVAGSGRSEPGGSSLATTNISPGRRTKSSAKRLPNVFSSIQGATSSSRYMAMLNATQESVNNATNHA